MKHAIKMKHVISEMDFLERQTSAEPKGQSSLFPWVVSVLELKSTKLLDII